MRISKVKQFEAVEEQLEKMIKSGHCNNCRQDTIILHSVINRQNIMKVCQNKDCFKYTDINKLTTWII